MQKPKILCFDPATRTGVAVGRVGGEPSLSSYTFGSDGTPNADVFGRAARTVSILIDLHAPALIAIELPFYTSKETNHDATAKLHGLFGAITGVARMRNVPVWTVTVASWRKVALGTAKFGSRHSAKKAAMDWCANIGWAASDDNAADAAGIFRWACVNYAPYGVIISPTPPAVLT